jgi:hypothetical protein
MYVTWSISVSTWLSKGMQSRTLVERYVRDGLLFFGDLNDGNGYVPFDDPKLPSLCMAWYSHGQIHRMSHECSCKIRLSIT